MAINICRVVGIHIITTYLSSLAVISPNFRKGVPRRLHTGPTPPQTLSSFSVAWLKYLRDLVFTFALGLITMLVNEGRNAVFGCCECAHGRREQRKRERFILVKKTGDKNIFLFLFSKMFNLQATVGVPEAADRTACRIDYLVHPRMLENLHSILAILDLQKKKGGRKCEEKGCDLECDPDAHSS